MDKVMQEMVAFEFLKMGSVGDNEVIIPGLAFLVGSRFDNTKLFEVNAICDDKFDNGKNNNN